MRWECFPENAGSFWGDDDECPPAGGSDGHLDLHDRYAEAFLKPFLIFDGLGYSKDSHKACFQGVSGSHSLPAMHRYVASAAVSSRCLKPTERILEVRFVTFFRLFGNHGEIMLKFLGMNLQKFNWRLFVWRPEGGFFSSFLKFQGLVFGVEGVFLRRGKGITNNTNRGWRVAKGIITDRSRGISFQSATFWMRVGSCNWIWARVRKRVRRWGRAMAVAADWFSLIYFHYGIALGHDIRVLDEDVGWFMLVQVCWPLSTVSPWPSGISACKSWSYPIFLSFPN